MQLCFILLSSVWAEIFSWNKNKCFLLWFPSHLNIWNAWLDVFLWPWKSGICIFSVFDCIKNKIQEVHFHKIFKKVKSFQKYFVINPSHIFKLLPEDARWISTKILSLLKTFFYLKCTKFTFTNVNIWALKSALASAKGGQ